MRRLGVIVVVLGCCGWPARAAAGPGDEGLVRNPLALARLVEVEDLEREIQRLEDGVKMKRPHLAASKRLQQRGAVSDAEVEREESDLRFDESRLAETRAFRELKQYELEVLIGKRAVDDRESFRLVLAWLEGSEEIARVDAEHRAYELERELFLLKRNAVGRVEAQIVAINEAQARATLALSRTRTARVRIEIAERAGDPAPKTARYRQMAVGYQHLRVAYAEAAVETWRKRLDYTAGRVEAGVMSRDDERTIAEALADAESMLKRERDDLEKLMKAPLDADPKPLPGRKPASRNSVALQSQLKTAPVSAEVASFA